MTELECSLEQTGDTLAGLTLIFTVQQKLVATIKCLPNGRTTDSNNNTGD